MPLPTLAEVKAELSIKADDDSNDTALQRILDAAVQKLTDLCGPLDLVDVDEVQPFQNEAVVLRQWPVASIDTVTIYPGALVVPAMDVVNGVYGWELNARGGVLDFDLFGMYGYDRLEGYPHRYGHVRVVYTAGRAELPATMIDALHILVDHLWRAAKNRVGVGQRSVFGGADPEKTSPFPAGFAMPKRASELLEYETKPDGIG